MVVNERRYNLIYLILSDIKAKSEWVYGDSSIKNRIKTMFSDGTFAMILYRCMQASNRWKLVPLAMIFNKLLSGVCHCVIGRGADFGQGFVLVHSIGVVINSQVVGGENIKIEHQVTIGAEKRECPKIGSNVFIGAGAKIIGKIRVGNNVKIGANSVVLEDVPDNVTVAGIPAKVVRVYK